RELHVARSCRWRSCSRPHTRHDVIRDRVEYALRRRLVAEDQVVQRQPVEGRRDRSREIGLRDDELEAELLLGLFDDALVRSYVLTVLALRDILETRLTQNVLGELVRQHVLIGLADDVVPVGLQACAYGLP